MTFQNLKFQIRICYQFLTATCVTREIHFLILSDTLLWAIEEENTHSFRQYCDF